MQESLEFYNKFDRKLIDDYIYGNKRLESAIIELSRFLPEDSNKILDVGCGIGWSSYEMSKYCPNAKIEGVDLSPILIETAQKLFSNMNLSYRVLNVLNYNILGTYDSVMMIDVYEHIPKSDRKLFHKSLKDLLKDQGRVIMACPTKFHQNWLRINKPEGLQPVDEDVDWETISQLSKDIEGEIIYFEYQKIWSSFDYLYAVIQVNPQYDFNQEIKMNSELILEEKPSRIDRVYKSLNINFKIPYNNNTDKNLLSVFVKLFKFLKKKLIMNY